jgi:RIO-like serine/threonine protein kinase
MELCDLLDALITAGLALHNNNLVHGDFRAHNILIDDEGGYKIMDSNALGLKHS